MRSLKNIVYALKSEVVMMAGKPHPRYRTGSIEDRTADGVAISGVIIPTDDIFELRVSSEMVTHPETAVDIGRYEPRPYHPNFSFPNAYIDSGHEVISTAKRKGSIIDLGIEGWLRPEDALKLYEGAYFAEGDILEIGTYKGLSAYIMATARRNAGSIRKIVTIDMSAEAHASARDAITSHGFSKAVDFILNDGASACQDLIADGRTFGFAFVDHSHAYEHVAAVCELLPVLMKPGALVAFHDYNDPRNSRRANVGESGHEYGVMAAIEDTLKGFRFVGVYGCCGVYQRL